jgi:hypothetical protein
VKATTKRIAFSAVAAGIVAIAAGLFSFRPTHPEFGRIVEATVSENRDAHRYLILGGAPFEVGAASRTSTWCYLNHPKLNSQPQWALALSARASLEDVKREDLRCKFYAMGDTSGAAAFGADWQGHAVRLPTGRVVFIRAATNQSLTYAVELLQVHRAQHGRKGRRSVEVRYMQMAEASVPDPGNGPNRPGSNRM